MVSKVKITAFLTILTAFTLVAQENTNIVFSGPFGGAVVQNNTYEIPSGEEAWAGFANEDASFYPINFQDAGEITFTGVAIGADVEVYFKFEYNPFPDTEPSFSTESVTINGSDEATYSVMVPANGSNTYSSFLLYITTLNAPVTLTNITLTSSVIVDPCAGVLCPDGEECVDGECVIDSGNGGPSMAAPTPPARDPENVISIFSEAYENIIIDNFDFNLCGGNAVEEETIEGNLTQYYSGAGCQGISMANNRIDASEFTNIHFDFYTNETDLIGKVFNLKLVDWGGNINGANSSGLEINFNGGSNPPLTAGSWISVDIDISAFGPQVIGNLTRSDIAEIHITSNLTNAWYDNLYLYKETYIEGNCNDGELNQNETGIDCGGSCEPCTGPPSVSAPTPPARDPEDVISIYSDTYENVTIDNFDYGQCGSTASEEVIIDGNLTQHYTGPLCQGIGMESNRIDASAYTNLHVDFYTDETNIVGKVFNLKLVDWAGNSSEVGASGLEINFNDGTNPGITPGAWISIDVDLTSAGPFVSGNLTRSDIAQIHITSNLTNAWYDNLYIYRDGLTPETCFDGILNQDETGIDCGGSFCDPCVEEVSGCIDVYATNYDANATIQALDEYGNLSCIYASCENIPEPGCIYVDGFGVFNTEFSADDCITYGGIPCSEDDTSGCMDENATNYDANATTQAVDQNENLNCIFDSCEDVPEPGCIYVDGFGFFNSEFGADDCVTYGGTPCTADFSIKEEEKNKTKVFPNPSKGNLTISSHLLLAVNAQIQLHDLVGKLVYTLSVTNSQNDRREIDLSKLTPGSYILTISDGTNSINKRIVKQ